jgi:predicted transglutaminase-like cysteine proteinase
MGHVVSNIVARVAVLAAFGLSGCAGLPQEGALKDATEVAYASASPIVDGGNAPIPPGFVSFCMHTPQACANRAGTTEAKVVVDDKTAAMLVAINTFVNKSITYEADTEHYGVANHWTLDAMGGYGDCKDYALAKREALRAGGIPDSALKIAIVRTPTRELHAVLTVDTDKGVLVLDSLTPQILTWSDTPYEWIERQSGDSPLHWVKVADSSTPSQEAILSGLRGTNSQGR